MALGLSLEQMSKRFLHSMPHCLSLDGTQFDSAQYHPVCEAVQQPAWRTSRQYVRRCYAETFGDSASSTLADKVLEEMCNFDWLGFIKVPRVNAPKWPREVQKKFKRFVDKQSDTPWNDYLAFEFHGTTPSGRASQTTVGNTLNSIFYAYYYIEKAGLSIDR